MLLSFNQNTDFSRIRFALFLNVVYFLKRGLKNRRKSGQSFHFHFHFHFHRFNETTLFLFFQFLIFFFFNFQYSLKILNSSF